jgi:hypothetical protein
LLINQQGRQVSYDASAFHAEIEYNYNYTQYQTEHARLLGLLDYFGVNLNPQIIWNAIPWSFVVDWVFSVGRFLDRFKVSNMEPKINIRRYLWSIKRKRTVVTTRYTIPIESWWHPPLKLSHHRTVPASVVEETAYRRQVGLPGSSLIESSGVSLKEFTLGAALVLSRRRHSHKPRG